MGKSIQLDLDGNDMTCMKEFDALKYPCRECDREDCDEREEPIMKHKYYISCSIETGFIGLYYCLDYSLDTIEGIQKISERIDKEGYGNAVILFFKELN